MSRVGKNPISIPKGVELTIADNTVKVKGAKGQQELVLTQGVSVAVEDGSAVVSIASSEKLVRAMYGTTRALIANMVQGVSEGFTKNLEIQGVGFRAQLQGSKLVLNIGFCHTVEIEAPEGISFKVPEPTKIEVSGANKQAVGQIAAEIREVRKPEPYKGKGIRYAGEQVRRKAGKQGK